MRVIWSPQALRQVERASDYLVEFSSRAAVRLAQGLIVAGVSPAQFPHRGRPVHGTTVRELVTAFPYIIRYRVVGDTVRTLRVRHTSRRPTNP